MFLLKKKWDFSRFNPLKEGKPKKNPRIRGFKDF